MTREPPFVARTGLSPKRAAIGSVSYSLGWPGLPEEKDQP